VQGWARECREGKVRQQNAETFSLMCAKGWLKNELDVGLLLLLQAAHADYPGGLLSLDAYPQYEQLLREDLAASEKQAAASTLKAAQGAEVTPTDLRSSKSGASGSERSVTSQEHRNAGVSVDGWDTWSDEEHHEASEAGPSSPEQKHETAFGELSQALREARQSQEGWESENENWEGKDETQENTGGLDIQVRFFPGLFCALAPGVFVLPSLAAVTQAQISDPSPEEGKGGAAECLGRGLPAIGRSVGADEALPPGVPLLAHWLGEMLTQLGLKPELFSLGPTSRAVAKAMSELPTVEARGSAGVVIVDRTLDLVSSHFLQACTLGLTMRFLLL
jgi:hypothetical protein